MEQLLYCMCTYWLCECLQPGVLLFMTFILLIITFFIVAGHVYLESTFYQRIVPSAGTISKFQT